MNFNNFARDLLSALPMASMGSTQPLTKASSTIRSDFLDSTIYVADLPLTITYQDLAAVFEQQIGSCDVVIKRHLFKNFHFAYVNFKDANLGNYL
jgi:RNA recognition motif-containing protein